MTKKSFPKSGQLFNWSRNRLFQKWRRTADFSEWLLIKMAKRLWLRPLSRNFIIKELQEKIAGARFGKSATENRNFFFTTKISRNKLFPALVPAFAQNLAAAGSSLPGSKAVRAAALSLFRLISNRHFPILSLFSVYTNFNPRYIPTVDPITSFFSNLKSRIFWM